MPLRRSVLLLVVGAVLSLGVLAYVSPPDPDWISGLWDNGDYDDIILLVTSGVGITDSHAIEDGRPLLFVGAMVALGVLAHASPPDPDWIGGLWDNGDYDDIILLVTSGVGITDSHAFEHGHPLVVVRKLISTVDDAPLAARPRLSSSTRAPPAV